MTRTVRSSPEATVGTDPAVDREIRPAESANRDALAALSWPETVVWLGSRLARALDYAGRRGVLHRDVKPANVLLTAEGVPELADFNISFGGNVSGASPVAYFGGSLAYMSPEQLEAVHPDRRTTPMDLDTRSDLYSLAVVLWELLTGRKPFDDDATDTAAGDTTTLDAMLDRRRRGVDEMHREVPPDCPAALRRVLLEALEPDPADPWSSGAEFAEQLDVCLDPRARDLVDPPERSWRLRLRTWIHPIMALAIAVSNLLAIWYSYHHNQRLIIGKLDPQVQQRFEQFTVTSYVVAFAIGTAFTVWMTSSVFAVAMGLRRGKSYDAASLARARLIGHPTPGARAGSRGSVIRECGSAQIVRLTIRTPTHSPTAQVTNAATIPHATSASHRVPVNSVRRASTI